MIGQLSFGAAAFAFAFLGFALLLQKTTSPVRLAAALAAFLTAFWAAGELLVGHYGAHYFPSASGLETLRTAAWILVLLLLQRRSLGLGRNLRQSFLIAVGLGFVITLQLLLDVFFHAPAVALAPAAIPRVAILLVATRLVLAISGLVLLHNLYVNSRYDGGFSFRLFAVGLGAFFAYDLNLYTLQFLLGRNSVALLDLRGAVDTLTVPLMYLSLRGEGDRRFHLSRQAAFQTLSFSMIGVYLIAMSLLSYGLKVTGGNWGQLLQVVFLAIAIILGALVILSPRFRAELRVRIARNFYRYRYDYRVEWLRFIDKIDAAGVAADRAPFRERLIEAIADVLDCPGGVLLEHAAEGEYRESRRSGWPLLSAPVLAADAAAVRFLRERGRIIEFDRLRQDLAAPEGARGEHGGLALPEWAGRDPSIWIGIPLIHRDQLIAILLLERSIAARDLNWEDFDLLRTLGKQGASYLAEAETQARLDDARSFEEFNRRFAFVMHDVKNVVSQLGLLARNAERHADNPEFRADMVATLNASVGKMSDLLKLLAREGGERADQAPASATAAGGEADVARILTLVVATLRRQRQNLELAGAGRPLFVRGDGGRLEAMFTHLVQNAIDASPPQAPVELAVRKHGAQLVVSITDHGEGMSPEFIRERLFRPFHSTKDGGFGIGVFEAREIARAHGGRVDVESEAGKGTVFTVTLPLLSANGAERA